MDGTVPVQVTNPYESLAQSRQGEQCCWSHAREFSSMHVIVRTHPIPPIYYIDRDEDKKQVQLELNIYFEKLTWPTTSTCLEITIDTMHQHVVSPVTPRMTMCMLSDELYGGDIAVYPDAVEARVRFSKMSPLSAWTPSWMTKLGISSPLSTCTHVRKNDHHNWVLSMFTYVLLISHSANFSSNLASSNFLEFHSLLLQPSIFLSCMLELCNA